jgi:hypothetical protein
MNAATTLRLLTVLAVAGVNLVWRGTLLQVATVCLTLRQYYCAVTFAIA